MRCEITASSIRPVRYSLREAAQAVVILIPRNRVLHETHADAHGTVWKARLTVDPSVRKHGTKTGVGGSARERQAAQLRRSVSTGPGRAAQDPTEVGERGPSVRKYGTWTVDPSHATFFEQRSRACSACGGLGRGQSRDSVRLYAAFDIRSKRSRLPFSR